MIRPYGPGKFANRVEELVYLAALDSTDYECDGMGNSATAVEPFDFAYLAFLARDAGLTLNADEQRALLAPSPARGGQRPVAWVVREDDAGFIAVWTEPTNDHAILAVREIAGELGWHEDEDD
jgi:hypothetical protein